MFYRQGCGHRNAGISPLQSFADALGHLTMLITMVFVFVYLLFLLTCGLFHWLLFTHNFLTGPSFLPHVAHPCCLFLGLSFSSSDLVEPRSVLYCTALLVHSVHRRVCFVSLCWFSQCDWFPSCWCLGHICSQIHMKSAVCVLFLVLMRGDEDATRKGVVRLHQSLVRECSRDCVLWPHQQAFGF